MAAKNVETVSPPAMLGTSQLLNAWELVGERGLEYTRVEA